MPAELSEFELEELGSNLISKMSDLCEIASRTRNGRATQAEALEELLNRFISKIKASVGKSEVNRLVLSLVFNDLRIKLGALGFDTSPYRPVIAKITEQEHRWKYAALRKSKSLGRKISGYLMPLLWGGPSAYGTSLARLILVTLLVWGLGGLCIQNIATSEIGQNSTTCGAMFTSFSALTGQGTIALGGLENLQGYWVLAFEGIWGIIVLGSALSMVGNYLLAEDQN